MAVANDADMLDASCECKMLLLALIPVVVLLSKAGQPVVVVVVVVFACGFRTLFAPVCMLTSVSMAFHVAFCCRVSTVGRCQQKNAPVARVNRNHVTSVSNASDAG